MQISITRFRAILRISGRGKITKRATLIANFLKFTAIPCFDHENAIAFFF